MSVRCLLLLVVLISGVCHSSVRAQNVSSLTRFDISDTPGIAFNATIGADGNLWFSKANTITRMSAAGDATIFSLPSSDANPRNLMLGVDGKIWFSQSAVVSGVYSNKIGSITSSGVIAEYDLPQTESGVRALAIGPSGDLWVSYDFNQTLNRVSVSGAISDVLLPVEILNSVGQVSVGNMAFDALGYLWLSHGNKMLTRMTADGSSHTTFDSQLSTLNSLIRGPDGNIWASDVVGRIGVFNSQGLVSEIESYDDQIAGPNSNYTKFLTLGADGNVWFLEHRSSTNLKGYWVGRITASLAITRYAVAEPNTQTMVWAGLPWIAVGADGNVWIGERDTLGISNGGASNIIRLNVPNNEIRWGAVFSSAQTGSRSFLRFFNEGTVAGSVTVRLADASTGMFIKQWTSPAIPGGAAVQYDIQQIEENVGQISNLPPYYSVTVEPQIAGSFQHVLWRAADGTLTNLSTCDSNVTAPQRKLFGVHSSLLGNLGYPSSIAIRTISQTYPRSLRIYDARNGNLLGTYQLPYVHAQSELLLPVSQIEAESGIVPTGDMYHYIVELPADSFDGRGAYLQNLVENQQAGVLTDMTTVCSLGTDAVPVQAENMQIGSVFSTVHPSSRSFLRFYNSGDVSGNVRLELANGDLTYNSSPSEIGPAFAVIYDSDDLLPGTAVQIGVGEIEDARISSNPKAPYFAGYLHRFASENGGYIHSGYYQNVLWRAADGTLTNLSTCGAGVTADPDLLLGVHTSLLDVGYPSTVVVNNTGVAPMSVELGLIDPSTGIKLGTFSTDVIPANAKAFVSVSDMEAALGIEPSANMYHYIVKSESVFSGFLQHLVFNQQAGVITDMTALCRLPLLAQN